MAKKYSIDHGSKDNGGKLDEFGKDEMVKEFEEAAFDPENKINEPTKCVKTQFGYHIIKIIERKYVPNNENNKPRF